MKFSWTPNHTSCPRCSPCTEATDSWWSSLTLLSNPSHLFPVIKITTPLRNVNLDLGEHTHASLSFQNYVPTVFENYTASFEINKQRIELNMWDTSGQTAPGVYLHAAFCLSWRAVCVCAPVTQQLWVNTTPVVASTAAQKLQLIGLSCSR